MAQAKMLPSGSWRVNLYIGKGADGKRMYKSFTAPTKREAEYLAASYNVAAHGSRPTAEMTLADAYTRYIDSKSNVLSPSTVREYRAAAKRDFPALMPLRLKTLTQEQIQIAVNRMAVNHSPTKTTAGTRFVDLPQCVLDKLRAVSTERVYPLSPCTLTNSFLRLSKAVLGRQLHFHALRHYSASALHALGVPDLYIMRRGGWESRETLDRIYQHILSDEQKRYNERIAGYFSDAFGDDATRNATQR